MITFIEEVLDDVLKNHSDVTQLTFILPSKRAGTFLKKKLAAKLHTSTFLPRILAIEDLIADISKLTLATSTQLQLELYHIYRQENAQNSDSFLEFLGWGQTLIGDFNEIDRYLIPTHDFFNYLTAVKELNHWSTDETPSDLVTNYLSFWRAIEKYYHSFSTHLREKGIGYQGMLYKESARKTDHYASKQTGFFVFAGFNALNAAEQKIIQSFLNIDKAEIYWDIDNKFLNDEKHVVNTFIKDYRKNWSYYKNHDFKGSSSYFEQSKKIKAVAVSQNIGQVKYVGQLLKDLSNQELTETAIVLGSETLLLPLLNSLPENVKNLNVTMGLPLNQVPDAAFFENWFTMQINSRDGHFFYKDVLALLGQPYTQLLLQGQHQHLRDHILKNNLIYITQTDFEQIWNNPQTKATKYLFSPWQNKISQSLNSVLLLINEIKEILLPQKNWIQLEYLYAFLKIFEQLKNLCLDYNYINDIKTLQRFYKELLAVETVDFKGDPYTGLQIMGVLESRVLDFKNIIVTSLNEGVLPSGKSQNSFIPFDLKLDYKLPTYREKDAVYAYHFFRLLQRASNVHLLYNNQADGLNSGEKSRFLLQLATDKNAVYNFTESSASAKVTLHKHELKQIDKTPAIIEALKKHANYGLSPSALTTYIRNPIDFYYKYVLGINELDDVEDIVAYNTLGTIVHQALEELYTPYLNTILSKEILLKLLKLVPQFVEDQFAKEYNLANIKTGKNLIIFHVAQQFVKNFIKSEISQLDAGNEIIIKSLEKKYKVPFTVGDTTIHLKGTVDRIDRFNGTTRVLDYKTGKVIAGELKISEWELLTSDYKKHGKAFQVLCYALMLSKESDSHQDVEAGIISFKNLSAGFMSFEENRNKLISKEILLKFEEHLQSLVVEILNIDIPFIEKEV
ncbi:PD-(D/E)XK nuclease family protein [Leeuwenhoekiella sp. A16]|uniref:PD-(D/E)XK nuclease family protein n=1 Tax=unclassified Leeuwenhoekiella TaxID=2615029 RepID=UPI003A7FDA1F